MLLNLASQTRRSRQVTECHHVGLAGFIAVEEGKPQNFQSTAGKCLLTNS